MEKKLKLENYSAFKLSNESLKEIKGGLIHGQCRSGMTFTVGSYDSSICADHGGVSYIIVNME